MNQLPKRNDEIELARFLLATAIVLFHMGDFLGWGGRLAVVPKGYLGVEAFFVLTGYFLCQSMSKEKRELELHVKEEEGNSWHLLKTYPIAAMSGTLGPKQAEGDLQAPEGFYEVYPSSLNPRSNHWLAFNVGYPNDYDRSLGRTGSYIMVHGGDSSVGCFAITDPAIEEVYTMVHQALEAGQPCVPVQIYPFEMTPQRMQREQDSPHIEFWRHLQPGWQFTHEHAAPYQPER